MRADEEYYSSEESDEDEEEERARLLAEEQWILSKRREAEVELFAKYDSVSINPRRSCWFLVPTPWLLTWQKWLEGGDLPSAVSTAPFFEGGGTWIREGLEAKEDYRAVNPMVWFLFVELYGTDESPVIARYTTGIYDDAPGGAELEELMRAPHCKARTEVNVLRGALHPTLDESSMNVHTGSF